MCTGRGPFSFFAALALATAPSATNASEPTVIEGFFIGKSVRLRDIDAASAFAALAANRIEQRGAKEVINRLDIFRKQARLASSAESQARQAAPVPAVPDPVAQFGFGSSMTPPPSSSFEGMGNLDNGELTGFVIWPPDNDGTVGRRHYVQMNNISFEIFDKKTGATVLGPLPNVAIWSSVVDEAGNPRSICGKNNDGDPIVLYDHDAERWILTQFAIGAFESGPPFLFGFGGYQCVAVSTSSDPTGSYYLYEFQIVPGLAEPPFAFGLNDYPKLGVWTDAIYLSTNEFVANPSTGFLFSFQGASATALDKRAMYKGKPANAIKFFLPLATQPDEPFHFSLQPSHWEGDKRPSKHGHRHSHDARHGDRDDDDDDDDRDGKGAPNIFIQNMDYETWGPLPPTVQPDGIHHWAFDANFKKPERSTFDDLGLIETPPFDSLGAFLYDSVFGLAVPQPGTTRTLDVLGQFTMTRAQYRAFGHHDSIIGNVATCVLPSGDTCVDVNGVLQPGGQIATRWFELRKTRHSGGFKLHQAGTWAPDTNHRWMGSAAMDRKGNIGLGYSVSSSSIFPSVRYATRKASDPKNQLGSEQSCVEGTASQTAVLPLPSGPLPVERWGDYSTISVDPQDECTFWYTNEFYDEDKDVCFPGGCWKTQICSFKVDKCGKDKDKDRD
jgi:hypothetical protein